MHESLNTQIVSYLVMFDCKVSNSFIFYACLEHLHFIVYETKYNYNKSSLSINYKFSKIKINVSKLIDNKIVIIVTKTSTSPI